MGGDRFVYYARFRILFKKRDIEDATVKTYRHIPLFHPGDCDMSDPLWYRLDIFESFHD